MFALSMKKNFKRALISILALNLYSSTPSYAYPNNTTSFIIGAAAGLAASYGTYKFLTPYSAPTLNESQNETESPAPSSSKDGAFPSSFLNFKKSQERWKKTLIVGGVGLSTFILSFYGTRFLQSTWIHSKFSSVKTKLESIEHSLEIQKNPDQALKLLDQTTDILMEKEIKDPSSSLEVTKTLDLLRQSVKNGHTSAEATLGILYFEGKLGLETDHEKALGFLTRGVSQKNAKAFYYLGKMIEEGLGGTPQDKKRALSLYEDSAAQNYTAAKARLGIAYFRGQLGLPQDFVKAREFLEKAARQKEDPEVLYCLGTLYEKGLGGTGKNYQKALTLYKKSAEQNYIESQIRLGEAHFKGELNLSDPLKGQDFLEKVEKETTDPQIIYKLAFIYKDEFSSLNTAIQAIHREEKPDPSQKDKLLKDLAAPYGVSVEQTYLAVQKQPHNLNRAHDLARMYVYEIPEAMLYMDSLLKKAVTLYQKVADLGYINPIQHGINLTIMASGVTPPLKKAENYFHQFNNQLPLEKSYLTSLASTYLQKGAVNKAIEIYQQGIDKGDSRCLKVLTCLYREGASGIPQDFPKALEILEEGVNRGNPHAMINLGMMYAKGEGVEKNLKKAEELFERSGKPGSLNFLAECYKNGNGVEKNLEKAAEIYQKLAHLGNIKSMNHLGMMYAKGEGVEKNLEKAEELFEKSFEKAEKNFQRIRSWILLNSLAERYENGNGVEKNLKKAAEIYQKLAHWGSKKASGNLARMYKNGLQVPQDEAKAAAFYRKNL
jgi:hypothetical protein